MSIVNKVKSLTARATMNAEDVRALLSKDHEEAKALAKQMQEAESMPRRMALLSKLKPALTAHSRAEEKVVYDALLGVRTADESHELADEGYVEHSLVDELLATLASARMSGDRWKAHAKVLYELLDHHVEEEESDIFALLGDHFSRDQLEAMGAQFKRAKADFLTRPGTGTSAPTRTPIAKRTTSAKRSAPRTPRRSVAARKKSTSKR